MTWLARTSDLVHPSGLAKLRTPLLVPSFSSKGFAYSPKTGKSEIRRIVVEASEFITEVALLSAYDIHYGHVQTPEDIELRPTLTILDSGGYEVSRDRDYSSVIDPGPSADPWSHDLMSAVYRDWPNTLPAAIVSYDDPESRASLEEQIEAAHGTFDSIPDQLEIFLIKPEPEQLTLQVPLRKICADPEMLRRFHVIGVTEKELGKSYADRMAEIARLRLALDATGISAPIHVFGALDPIAISLYFVSGAEIFDGLTWLRYGYANGACMYVHDVGALEYGLHASDNSVKMRTIASNCYYLEELKIQLEVFAHTMDFSKLLQHGELARGAWDTLTARLARGGN